eukprot:5530577-Alexandrium_andersonii.AAC.1
MAIGPTAVQPAAPGSAARRPGARTSTSRCRWAVEVTMPGCGCRHTGGRTLGHMQMRGTVASGARMT